MCKIQQIKRTGGVRGSKICVGTGEDNACSSRKTMDESIGRPFGIAIDPAASCASSEGQPPQAARPAFVNVFEEKIKTYLLDELRPGRQQYIVLDGSWAVFIRNRHRSFELWAHEQGFDIKRLRCGRYLFYRPDVE